LLTLGFSGGLVPCPDAIAILLVAVTVNKISFGMLLIVAFSLGLALILILIGIATVQGVRILTRYDFINRFSRYSPFVSAVVVVGLGIGLTWSSLTSFATLSSLSSQSASQTLQNEEGEATPPGRVPLNAQPAVQFDLKQAKLLYLAQDSNKRKQLFALPVSGGEAISITQGEFEVLDFTLSSDRKSIVYTMRNSTGKTSIWIANVDGSNVHLVLDCSQTQCDNPIWSPDNKKLFYERRGDSQNSALYVLSIWSLDLASDETSAVFQDPAFPSFAPRFSPDGQWLSYISPSTNTIQIYNLYDDRKMSISTRSGIPPLWSPTSDALVYHYDSADITVASHLKKFDLVSGQIVDLGGTMNQRDATADWSPNGQWVAVIRYTTGSNNTPFHGQIVLVQPDGKNTITLLDQPDTSLGHLSWSPDSRYLVFNRYPIGDSWKPEIWIMDVQTGQAQKSFAVGTEAILLPGVTLSARQLTP
jgi:Tol biopolymer transport system component